MRQPKIFRRPTIKTGQALLTGVANMPPVTGIPGAPTIEQLAPRVVAGDGRIYNGGLNRPSWTYTPGPGLPFGFTGPEMSNNVS